MYDKRKAADYIELIEESQENYRKNPEKYRDKNIELLPPDVNESMANGAVGEVDLLEKVCSFCKEINLYTYWQGFGYAKSTPEIKYLLVAQDFGNPFNAQNKIIKNILKMNAGELNTQYLDNADKDAWITDKNLIRLFEVLGYKGADGIDKKRHSELFFTNFSLGYRAGKESGSMTVKMMMEDSKYFKRLCDILEPKYILCLGKLTFQCVYETLKGDPIRNLEIANYNEYISKHPEIIYENDKYTCQIFPLAHCGSMGTMNRNKIEGSNSNKLTSDGTTKKDPLEKQIEDWQWVKNASR